MTTLVAITSVDLDGVTGGRAQNPSVPKPDGNGNYVTSNGVTVMRSYHRVQIGDGPPQFVCARVVGNNVVEASCTDGSIIK